MQPVGSGLAQARQDVQEARMEALLHLHSRRARGRGCLHCLNLLMTVIVIVLGGVLSTLWVLARR